MFVFIWLRLTVSIIAFVSVKAASFNLQLFSALPYVQQHLSLRKVISTVLKELSKQINKKRSAPYI